MGHIDVADFKRNILLLRPKHGRTETLHDPAIVDYSRSNHMAMSQKPGPLGTLSHSWLMDVDSPKFGNFIDNLTHPHILFITWASKHAVFPN